MCVQLAPTRCGERTSEATDKLIDRMNDLYKIRLKVPHLKAARCARKFDSKEYERDRQEWVSGVSRDAGDSWRSRLWAWRKDHSTPKDWKPAGVERLMKLVQHIEQHLGQTLVRGSVGCPYPFHPTTMPFDWTRAK